MNATRVESFAGRQIITKFVLEKVASAQEFATTKVTSHNFVASLEHIMTQGKCPSHHGMTSGRGCSHASLGTFGRMFEHLSPAYFSDEALEALGAPKGLMHDRTGASKDSDIPAAYTFFAQFVDHDVTLDVSSQLNSPTIQEPETLGNLRTMTLDLDCLYAFGPEASPYLFEDDRLVVGNPENESDLRRVVHTDSKGKITEVGRALIGDPRNDENIFVSQLQFAFHKFHNI